MRNKVLICVVLLLLPLFLYGEEVKPVTQTAIKLPKPNLKGKISLEEAILSRRTRRTFDSKPLTLSDVSQVLWAAQGITDDRWKHRAAPSAGALFPIDLYILIKDKGVDGISAGIYRYVPDGHYLQTRHEGDVFDRLRRVGYTQTFFADPPLCLIITAEPKRTTWKYGERGYRYIYIEAGHIAQNIQLIGESLGFSIGLVGAFKDESVSELLELKKDEIPIYIIPVGHRRKTE